ncbi:hypothetical protein TNCV_1450701 [Trichonephila clavipes]|nr:hypothetical protein TNCV_1450701 [Trichonephila clavipes]
MQTNDDMEKNFDYRKDGPKDFRFISALNGKQTQPCKQPMKVGGKILTSDLDIAKIFLKYYRIRLATFNREDRSEREK